MSALDAQTRPARGRLPLRDRPGAAARRQRAEDGALTELTRALLRDARESRLHAPPTKTAPVTLHPAQRTRCRESARPRLRPGASPLAAA